MRKPIFCSLPQRQMFARTVAGRRASFGSNGHQIRTEIVPYTTSGCSSEQPPSSIHGPRSRAGSWRPERTPGSFTKERAVARGVSSGLAGSRHLPDAEWARSVEMSGPTARYKLDYKITNVRTSVRSTRRSHENNSLRSGRSGTPNAEIRRCQCAALLIVPFE